MGRPERNGLAHAHLEANVALARNAAHQVHADVFEPGQRRFDGPARIVGRMRATERAQHLVVEALHADGQPVHAQRPDVAHHALGQAFGVRFHGAFHVGLEPHGQGQRVQQHRQARKAQMARGPSAEVHRFDGAQLAFFRLATNLKHQVVHVRVDLRRIRRHRRRGEVAVSAPLHAERQVQVQRAIRIMRHDGPFPATRRTPGRSPPRSRRR